MSDPAIQGSIRTSTKNAKARFLAVPAERIAAHISAQPEVSGPVEIESLEAPDGAGASNGIAFVRVRMDIGEGLKPHDLVLRYSPGVQLLKQKSFTHEYLTLNAVSRAGLMAPRPSWLDAHGAALGVPGYFMERIDATPPSAAMYSAGPLADAAPHDRHRMMLDAVRFHGRLRREAIGPEAVPHLLERGVGPDPLSRELNWWLEEIRLSAAADDPRRKLVERAHAWLVENRPVDLPAPALVHGDSQVANMMYRDGRIVAVLDWELSHLGHAELDVRFLAFITEFMKAADRHVEGTPSEEEYIEAYERESGEPVRRWGWFGFMSALRNAIVMLSMGDAMPGGDRLWDVYRAALEAAEGEARLEARTFVSLNQGGRQ